MTDQQSKPTTCKRWQLVPDAENPKEYVFSWCPDGIDDIDELFERVFDGTATDIDDELFHACLLDRFAQCVHGGRDVEPWILRALADAFQKVLMGAEWNDELRLPGRPLTPVRPWRDQRNLEIYCYVANAHNLNSVEVTKAIEEAGARFSVSYETARAAYYRWEKLLLRQ